MSGIICSECGRDIDALGQDMRKHNPSDNAERRFFMLVEQALGAHR